MPGRGSLAEVLPESFKGFFAGAANVFDEVDTIGWTGMSGREYAWRLCRAVAQRPSRRVAGERSAHDGDGSSRRLRPRLSRPPSGARLSTARVRSRDADTADVRLDSGRASDRLLGILVHRLFEHARPAMPRTPTDRGVATLCRRLLRAEERVAARRSRRHSSSQAADVWLSARRLATTCATRWRDGADCSNCRSRRRRTDRPHRPRQRSTAGARKRTARLLVVEFKTGRAPTHPSAPARALRRRRAAAAPRRSGGRRRSPLSVNPLTASVRRVRPVAP